jgi:hypothetical protein
LATVAASAALALQLFAGASAAAVPNGTSSGDVLGEVGGDGYAGFTSAFRFQDNNLAKLYFEADITNGASLPIFEATRNGNPVNCGASASVIKCEFKNVKNGETFAITFAIKPATAADVVATGGWSSTGYVVGGNNSHGDAWGIGGKDAAGNQRLSLTATYNADGDYAAGFGNSTLSTQTSGNKQSAKLTGLPAGKWAAVDDNAGSDGFGFSVITLNVNGGAAEDFNLVITYPKNTQAPKSYLHISDGYTNTEYFLCGRGQTVNCFTWDKKTSTATLFLAHNGSLRRTS